LSAGLAAHRRQHRVGPLLGDDLLDHAPGDRLDVGRVGHLRVGHDRRRIAVDEDDAVALLAQRLAGLGAGVVELAGLADDDRPGADDQDRLQVGALRHAPSRVVHQGDEAVEQVADVVRPGRGLGVALEAERRLVDVRQALQRAVEQRDVGRPERRRQRLRIDREAVVLAGDRDPAAVEVLHRMVGAVVSELHLVGAGAAGQRHDLVAEADAEGRHAAVDAFAGGGDRVVAGLGIARAVGEEHAVGLHRQHLGRRRLRRHHRDPAAAVGEHAQDVELDAVVVGDDVELGSLRAP
jgi:hypothetical protein